MTESLSKNFIDYEEYPQSADLQARCVNMIADLFNAPTEGTAVGTSTVGSSEAIMLAVLAMKRRWKKRRQTECKSTENPNIIMSSAVQVCWEKAARYFEINERYVFCTKDRFLIDPEEAVGLCDENTIGIVSILGTTYTGGYEDTKAINDLLFERKVNIPIHVDAASGGFVAPFITPGLEWDFRLENVVSINVSGHKVSNRCSNEVKSNVFSMALSIPELAGLCGALRNIFLKISSSTSTTSAQSSHLSRSTSLRERLRSLASIIS